MTIDPDPTPPHGIVRPIGYKKVRDLRLTDSIRWPDGLGWEPITFLHPKSDGSHWAIETRKATGAIRTVLLGSDQHVEAVTR